MALMPVVDYPRSAGSASFASQIFQEPWKTQYVKLHGLQYTKVKLWLFESRRKC